VPVPRYLTITVSAFAISDANTSSTAVARVDGGEDERDKKAISTLIMRQGYLKEGASLLLEKESVAPDELSALKTKAGTDKSAADSA